MTTDLVLAQERAAGWLAQRKDPIETDRLLRSRASSLNVGLVVRDGSAEVQGPREAALALAQTIEGTMVPATPGMIEDWMAELDVLAPRRKEDSVAMALKLRVYTDRLQAYPADVAKAAMLKHLWKFFPSWAELQEVCEDLVRERRLMLIAARRATEEREEPQREVISYERRMEILREMGMTEERLTAEPKRMPEVGEGEAD